MIARQEFPLADSDAAEAASPPSRGPGELASFFGAALQALVRFWSPAKAKDELLVVADEEDEAPAKPPRQAPAGVLDSLIRKVAPYPGQEG